MDTYLAIAKVEADFWNRPSRTKRKRDKINSSDQTSWSNTYERFHRYFPENKIVNLCDIQIVIDRQKRGTKTFKRVVCAMKVLCRFARNEAIINSLDELNVTQTEYKKLQNITLQDFLRWRDKVLGVTSTLRSNVRMDVSNAWLWVLSV